MQLQHVTMSEIMATVGYIFCGDILIDRFRPHCDHVQILCNGAVCDNEELKSLTCANKRVILEEIKHPFCHYFAGLIGSHLKPPHEKIGHRRFRAVNRLEHLFDD